MLTAGLKQRLPHAILIHGPEGNGGLALALAMMSYLLCEKPTETDSCGECDACSKNKSLIHPDVHFSFPIISSDGAKLSNVFIQEWRKALIDNPFLSYEDWMEAIKSKEDQNKQGNISADECRDILKRLSLKSYEGGKKFMLIWLPEFLGQNGNILLKLIEEPPDETHLILVTEDVNLILPTIISRTQIYNVPAYSAKTVTEYLRKHYEMAEKDAETVAYLSRGNMSLAQQLMHEEEKEYTERMQQWLQYCYARNIQKINDWVTFTSGQGREKIKQFLENCLYVFGECLHCRYIKDHKPRVPESNANFILNISKILNEKKIEKIYSKINDTIYHIDRNANAKISLFNLSLNMRNILLEK